MGSVIHQTRAVQVWVDADLGIASMVEALNLIPGVRTHASCQGSIGEGGPEPYGPYVEVSWPNAETIEVLRAQFLIETKGPAWGYARPKE